MVLCVSPPLVNRCMTCLFVCFPKSLILCCIVGHLFSRALADHPSSSGDMIQALFVGCSVAFAGAIVSEHKNNIYYIYICRQHPLPSRGNTLGALTCHLGGLVPPLWHLGAQRGRSRGAWEYSKGHRGVKAWIFMELVCVCVCVDFGIPF